jgi:hypothetical protein
MRIETQVLKNKVSKTQRPKAYLTLKLLTVKLPQIFFFSWKAT